MLGVRDARRQCGSYDRRERRAGSYKTRAPPWPLTITMPQAADRLAVEAAAPD